MKHYKYHLIDFLEESFIGKYSINKSLLLTHKETNLWDLKKDYRNYTINDSTISKIIFRVLNKYKGENVNDAFSYYCKLVPKKFQYEFYNTYYINSLVNIHETGYYTYSHYIIDENNLIQENVYKKSTSRLIKFKSWDYNNWIYDKFLHQWFTVDDYIKYKAEFLLDYKLIYKIHQNILNNNTIYTTGYNLVFDNKKSKLYKKLKAENKQRKIVKMQ